MLPNLLSSWRILVAFNFGLIVATVSSNWSYFRFNKEISISDLFTALLGGAIGLYIGSELSSKISSDRVEKDLLIGELRPIRSNIQVLANTIQKDPLILLDIVALLKNISTDFNMFRTSLTFCSNSDKLQNTCFSIFQKLRAFNNEITSRPATNGVLLISLSDINTFDIDIRKIDSQIFHLIVSLNQKS